MRGYVWYVGAIEAVCNYSVLTAACLMCAAVSSTRSAASTKR